jgi:hypothetical protein
MRFAFSLTDLIFLRVIHFDSGSTENQMVPSWSIAEEVSVANGSKTAPSKSRQCAAPERWHRALK